MLPLTFGFLVAGPVSGWLSDRYGARLFATGGMLLTAAAFAALIFLPADFNDPLFAGLILLNGIGTGLFVAPNTAGIMNAVPADAAARVAQVPPVGSVFAAFLGYNPMQQLLGRRCSTSCRRTRPPL